VDHTTRPVLMERAAYLKKMARASEGSASEVLKEYPRHNIQLSVRLRSGIAELHEHFADIFFVLDGRATLVTGGKILKPQTTALGEVRGTMIEGGDRQELRVGDVAHIAAGTPHQILVAGDATFSAMVIKVQESD
jgi:mannose-6-phosphate isomerase-like protein (cupin superfamily)